MAQVEIATLLSSCPNEEAKKCLLVGLGGKGVAAIERCAKKTHMAEALDILCSALLKHTPSLLGELGDLSLVDPFTQGTQDVQIPSPDLGEGLVTKTQDLSLIHI